MFYVYSEKDLNKLRVTEQVNYVFRQDKPVYRYMLVPVMALGLRVVEIRAINFNSVRDYLKIKHGINLKTDDFKSRTYPLMNGKYGKIWEFEWNGVPYQIYKGNIQ